MTPSLRGHGTRRQPARPIRRAFTLFELILAVTLVGVLFAAVLSFFWQSAEVRKQAGKMADRTNVARQMLDRLATELRGVPGMDDTLFPIDTRLQGTRRDITFLTTASPDQEQYRFYQPSETPPQARHDLRKVSYALWVEEDQTNEAGDPLIGGIIRMEQKTLNIPTLDTEDPLQLRQDLWSHELGYLEFRYFDGVEWDTKWDITEGNALPQLIEITIGFDSITAYELEDGDLQEQELGDEEPYNPNRYSTIVRMPAADRFFSSRVQRVGKQMTAQMGVEGGE